MPDPVLQSAAVPQSLSVAVIDASTTTIAAIANSGNTVIRVWGLDLMTDSAVRVQIRSGSTPLGGAQQFQAKYIPPSDTTGSGAARRSFPLYETAPGEALNINLSAAVRIAGCLWYSKS